MFTRAKTIEAEAEVATVEDGLKRRRAVVRSFCDGSEVRVLMMESLSCSDRAMACPVSNVFACRSR